MASDLSLEDQAKEIKRRFVNEHLGEALSLSLMSSCAITQLGIVRPKETPRNQRDNFCIRIELREPLPSGISFPDDYGGLRVIVDVVAGDVIP